MIVDTREQKNQHITDYFNSKEISYIERKLDYGDYAIMLPANQELGISKDMYLNATIERKNSVDELASTISDRVRFNNELLRATGSDFHMIVEDSAGYENLILGNYRSKFKPYSLLASLKSLEARYSFNTAFISKKTAGNYIYHHLRYRLREQLK